MLFHRNVPVSTTDGHTIAEKLFREKNSFLAKKRLGYDNENVTLMSQIPFIDQVPGVT